MICPKCKTTNKADAAYCHECGVALQNNTLSALDKELLHIIEVNSYSKKILAAYRGRKLANKICKEKYGKTNYKEYVEMLMVKYFPNEHAKSELGKKYVLWIWISTILLLITFGFGLPISALILWDFVIPTYKELKEMC